MNPTEIATDDWPLFFGMLFTACVASTIIVTDWVRECRRPPPSGIPWERIVHREKK